MPEPVNSDPLAATVKDNTVIASIEQHTTSWFDRLSYLGFDCNRWVN